MRGEDEVRRFLPLSSAAFHVLVSLADGEKHGYAVLKEINRRAEGAVTLSAATLYATLNRLLNDGLIEEAAERPDPELDDERRRYYAITPLGRRVALADMQRMETALALARGKRLDPKPRRGGS